MGNVVTGLDQIAYFVASSLWYPVLLLELASLLWIVFQLGAITKEGIERRMARSMMNVEAAESSLAFAVKSNDSAGAVNILRMFDYGPIVGPVVRSLIESGISRHRIRKLIIDAEQTALRRLDKTRMFIRLGPVLGLMTTLIPISPALVSLAKGDMKTLATELILAFSTTIIGLLIGSVAYVVSVGRERWYSQDLSDLEYVLDRAAE